MGRWSRQNNLAASAAQARKANEDMPEIDGIDRTPDDKLTSINELNSARYMVAEYAMVCHTFYKKHGYQSEGLLELLGNRCDEMKVASDAFYGVMSDDSIDQSQWVGDHCGYLAAQCESRQRINVEPTAEQLEAWAVCNTTTASKELF